MNIKIEISKDESHAGANGGYMIRFSPDNQDAYVSFGYNLDNVRSQLLDFIQGMCQYERGYIDGRAATDAGADGNEGP